MLEFLHHPAVAWTALALLVAYIWLWHFSLSRYASSLHRLMELQHRDAQRGESGQDKVMSSD